MEKKSHAFIIMTIIGVIAAIGGAIMFLVPILIPKEALPELSFPKIPSATAKTEYYSNLTGLKVADEAAKKAPTFCVQTPNGTDGARPQAGLNQAGVVFEAIAEAGITRFAAIYQNPSSAVIGPIRSLRLYYLQWDTPFDCTIVHAGGADDAIEAVRAGGYKDLSENYVYMYRGSYGGRLWNNLFTTGAYLMQMNSDYGYGESNVTGFARMTPDEAERARIDATVDEKLVITEPAKGSTAAIAPKTTLIGVNFGGWATFNVVYNYDAGTNSYARSYETGVPHEVYVCPEENLGEVNPEDSCYLSQLSPSVVVAMFVEEQKAADNYHEDITTLGSGEAYVFQNGVATHGRWEKNSVHEQIRFYDESGAEIRLAPGQTFVEAVPRYGSIDFN
ncbi:DUF3048 domain-containing protein [Candidatus Saccharibacteria bacterium]|nr:DUF3048 domain-containing protein [Candidatus Saccharibacteria bacterium]